MVYNKSQLNEVNVLASQANWAWPQALKSIFQPRGINLLVAGNSSDFLNIIRNKRIHTTILDIDSEKSSALAMIKMIRMSYPMLPCILLSSSPGQELLDKASK